MVHSLKTLSYMVIARTICDNHISNQIFIQSSESVQLLAQKIKRWGLPKRLEFELILIATEFGKRKISKNHSNDVLRLTGDPFKDRRVKEIVRNFYADPSLWIHVPRLRDLFPEEHHHKTVIKLFVTLLVPNFCENPKAIRDCWSSDTFVHCHKTFLINFRNIWQCVSKCCGEFASQWLPSYNCENNVISRMLLYGLFTYPCKNEVLPWFLFEVLSDEQRNKMLLFEETALLVKDYSTKYIFASIFMHWPWQKKAFDMFIAWKEKLSNDEEVFLLSVLRAKRNEKVLHESGILPHGISLYSELEHSLKKKGLLYKLN